MLNIKLIDVLVPSVENNYYVFNSKTEAVAKLIYYVGLNALDVFVSCHNSHSLGGTTYLSWNARVGVLHRAHGTPFSPLGGPMTESIQPTSPPSSPWGGAYRWAHEAHCTPLQSMRGA